MAALAKEKIRCLTSICVIDSIIYQIDKLALFHVIKMVFFNYNNYNQQYSLLNVVKIWDICARN